MERKMLIEHLWTIDEWHANLDDFKDGGEMAGGLIMDQIGLLAELGEVIVYEDMVCDKLQGGDGDE